MESSNSSSTLSYECKKKNVFDWDEKEENSMINDKFFDQISVKNNEGIPVSKTRLNDSIPSSLNDLKGVTTVSNSKSHRSINSEVNLKFSSPTIQFTQIQKALNPLADSVKNFLIKPLNFEKFNVISKNKCSENNSFDGKLSIQSKSTNIRKYVYQKTDIPMYESTTSIMSRIISNQPYSFNEYQSLQDKEKLLVSALSTCHSSCIVKVVLFLRETLKHEIFKNLLEKYPEASNEYRYFLKALGQLDALKIVHSKPTLDQLLMDYLAIMSQKLTENTLESLDKLYKKYSNYVLYRDYTSHIKNHMEFLRLQLSQKQAHQALVSLNNPKIQQLPQVLLKNMSCETVMEAVYRLTIDYLKQTPSFPENFKKIFFLNDTQYEYIIVKACCNLNMWDHLKKFFSSKVQTGIFKKKIPISFMGMDNQAMMYPPHQYD